MHIVTSDVCTSNCNLILVCGTSPTVYSLIQWSSIILNCIHTRACDNGQSYLTNQTKLIYYTLSMGSITLVCTYKWSIPRTLIVCQLWYMCSCSFLHKWLSQLEHELTVGDWSFSGQSKFILVGQIYCTFAMVTFCVHSQPNF